MAEKSEKKRLFKNIGIIFILGILGNLILIGLRIDFFNSLLYVWGIFIFIIIVVLIILHQKLWQSKEEFIIAMVSIILMGLVGFYMHTSYVDLNKQPTLVFDDISSNFSNNSTHSWIDLEIYVKNIGEESTMVDHPESIRILAITYYGDQKYDIIHIQRRIEIKPDNRELLSGNIGVNPNNPVPEYVLLRLIYDGEIVDEKKYNP